MWAQLQAAKPFTPSELVTDPNELCYKAATSTTLAGLGPLHSANRLG
jgi:hypothetical protein